MNVGTNIFFSLVALLCSVTFVAHAGNHNSILTTIEVELEAEENTEEIKAYFTSIQHLVNYDLSIMVKRCMINRAYTNPTYPILLTPPEQ